MNQQFEIEKLLKLKRYETPGRPYFNAFLDEFHRYQRSVMLPTRRSFGERMLVGCQDIAAWVESHVRVLAPAGVAAMLLVAVGIQFQPGTPESAATVAAHEAAPVESFVDGSSVYTERSERPAELVVAEYSSFERDFSGSQFVTGKAPMSYDSVLAF